jgi:hypothetical protein
MVSVGREPEADTSRADKFLGAAIVGKKTAFHRPPPSQPPLTIFGAARRGQNFSTYKFKKNANFHPLVY